MTCKPEKGVNKYIKYSVSSNLTTIKIRFLQKLSALPKTTSRLDGPLSTLGQIYDYKRDRNDKLFKQISCI